MHDKVAAVFQEGPPPKDGTPILGWFNGCPHVVEYMCWDVGGEMLPDGSGSPPDEVECGWCLTGDDIVCMGNGNDPERWARII